MIFGLVGLMATAPTMSNARDLGFDQESREDFGSISSYCRDRLKVLTNAKRHAALEAQRGNYVDSAKILKAALLTAHSQLNHRYSSALTSKAIKRGVILLANLEAAQETRQKARTINHFLFSYFDFIEEVSNRLDIPFYQPGNGGFSRIFASNTQFERLFVNFAHKQVQMVLETMTTTDSEGLIYPIGSTNMLLTALKITTQAMADDLSESIFAAKFACQIDSLEIVSYNIDKYLTAGDFYSDDATAVQEFVSDTQRALGGDRGCRSGYESTESRTTDAISRPFTLERGTTQQVKLNGARNIKKIIVSAEGIRQDAMFDVVVNGDIKGTIYVPGSDPSYFVTVNEYADSIEFVSRNGNAIISKILVIRE